MSLPGAVPVLTGLRLPIPWDEFDLPNPLATRTTVLSVGPVAWSWSVEPPAFGIPVAPTVVGAQPAPGWDLDHVVLLVPELDEATATLAEAGLSPRLRIDVRGRPTAFFRVGPLLEVIQSPVRGPALYGAALVTEESLEVVALRWRSMGRDVTDPRPAMQPGRRILTVKSLEAGLAVMSPDGAAAT